MKNLFIIGDVHGCLHTLQALLSHWNKENDQVIFVGDLIDRGNFSPETVAYVRELQKEYTDTVILMGNHEYEAYRQFKLGNLHWFRQMGEETLAQYKKGNFDFASDAEWFGQLPLFWENDDLIISHAGLCDVANPFNHDDFEFGILWTRNPLKKLDKIQVHGHTPKAEGPIYIADSNSWNIDSACVYGHKLSALHFNMQTKQIEFFEERVHGEDVR